MDALSEQTRAELILLLVMPIVAPLLIAASVWPNERRDAWLVRVLAWLDERI